MQQNTSTIHYKHLYISKIQEAITTQGSQQGLEMLWVKHLMSGRVHTGVVTVPPISLLLHVKNTATLTLRWKYHTVISLFEIINVSGARCGFNTACFALNL